MGIVGREKNHENLLRLTILLLESLPPPLPLPSRQEFNGVNLATALFHTSIFSDSYTSFKWFFTLLCLPLSIGGKDIYLSGVLLHDISPGMKPLPDHLFIQGQHLATSHFFFFGFLLFMQLHENVFLCQDCKTACLYFGLFSSLEYEIYSKIYRHYSPMTLTPWKYAMCSYLRLYHVSLSHVHISIKNHRCFKKIYNVDVFVECHHYHLFFDLLS